MLAAAGAFTATSASGAGRSDALSYVVHNAGTEYVTRAGSSATFPGPLVTGDRIFSRDTLTRGEAKIGFDNEVCVVTFDDNDLCRTISVFPGQGQVSASWLWVGRNASPVGPRHFAGVIDGGTGRFVNARGQFQADVQADGSLRITTTIG
jgi:hypothetical protein